MDKEKTTKLGDCMTEQNIENLLTLIERVDKHRISSPLSDHGVVREMLRYKQNGGKLTSRQVTLLDKIRRNYKDRRKTAGSYRLN